MLSCFSAELSEIVTIENTQSACTRDPRCWSNCWSEEVTFKLFQILVVNFKFSFKLFNNSANVFSVDGNAAFHFWDFLDNFLH